MKKQLVDGVIEIVDSDAHTGPDKRGQRVGSAQWYRVNNGVWTRSVHRTRRHIVEWLECSQSVEDFLYGEEE